MCNCLSRLFDDRRMVVTLLMVWLCVVSVSFQRLGLLDSSYMSFGPGPNTVFMTLRIDTWNRWGFVAGWTVANTCINDFAGDSISPWILNTICDHKGRYLPYSKAVCLWISQMYSIYGLLMGVFNLHLVLSQFDFVLIRLFTDVCVNVFTNMKFMANKTSDPVRYHADLEMQPVQCAGQSEADGLLPT